MKSMRKEYRDGGEISISDPQVPLDLLIQWLADAIGNPAGAFSRA